MKLKYFTAKWCAPCKMYAPVINRVASENSEVEVEKVDIDENSDAAKSYGITSVPTVIEVDDQDNPVKTLVGAWSYAEFKEAFGL